MKRYGGIRNSRVVRSLLLILVPLLVLELLSKSVVYYILGLKDTNYAHYYLNDRKIGELTWTERYTPHPYFGYESPSMRASETILSEVGDDDFVLGILGGSIAGGFAEYAIRHPTCFESLRKAIPTIGEKNLKIVNLANGGFKQPQPFFVATYFMDKLDLVINIDGFNDADPRHLMPVYPLEFPALSAQFYGRASQGGVYAVIAHLARWVYKNLNRASLGIPGLSRSSLYFVVWYDLHELLYRVYRASESAYYANEFAAHQTEALRKTSRKEIIQKRIAIWKKYTVLEDDLVRKRTGKPVFFFLQPNQYLKDSKPFSEQERKIAIDPSRVESHHEMMILLKAAAHDLRGSGVPSSDLTAIFSDIEEATYVDNCCHLNDLGNQIMADAIVSSIVLYHAGGTPQVLLHE